MTEGDYKQVAGYIDRLHGDIGKLIVLVERLLEERGFVPFPSAGTRGSWGLSNSYLYPDRWRIPYILRFFAPAEEDAFERSLCYFILLETRTVFPFPAMLCAHIEHPVMPEPELFKKLWSPELLASLAQKDPRWRAVRQEGEWHMAEPVNGATINHLRGYFLNVFDLVDRRHVIDNVVAPLTGANAHLDELLTVPSYGFGSYKEEKA